ncbi:helix-turn-helix domain-containing protein [Plantibacter sp. Mn2098]|uniref:helix-turn-helix domain-containing protein n=1 Tax=Plantibacter sp. Mn2098 TaxID=3395266 RepID=UPI003BE87DC3
MLVREALGDVLRSLRTDQGRTLNDVATDANVSTPYLSELERGRKDASSEVLATIAAALRTRLDLVMFEIADRIESGTGSGVLTGEAAGAEAARGHLVMLPSVAVSPGDAESAELAELPTQNAALLAA